MSVESEDSVEHAVQGRQGGVCQGWSQNDNLLESTNSHLKFINRHNHDTISMAMIDKMSHIAVGTSTNGATFKIPGSYQVVESMRWGMEPPDAATDAISRITRRYPDFVGAVFATNKKEVHAGASHGWTFQHTKKFQHAGCGGHTSISLTIAVHGRQKFASPAGSSISSQ